MFRVNEGANRVIDILSKSVGAIFSSHFTYRTIWSASFFPARLCFNSIIVLGIVPFAID